MTTRILLLLLVGFLGSMAFATRTEDRPLPLLKSAAIKTLQLLAWTALGFGILYGTEILWLDN